METERIATPKTPVTTETTWDDMYARRGDWPNSDAWAEAMVADMWNNIPVGDGTVGTPEIAKTPEEVHTREPHAHTEHDHQEHVDLPKRERRIAYLGAAGIALCLSAAEGVVQWAQHKSGQPLSDVFSSAMFNDMKHNGIIDVSAYLSLAWASTTTKVGQFLSRLAGGTIVAGSGLSLGAAGYMALYERDELLHGQHTTTGLVGAGLVIGGNIANTHWVHKKTEESNHPDHVRARKHAGYDRNGSIAKVVLNEVPLVGELVAGYYNAKDVGIGLEGVQGDGLSCEHDHAATGEAVSGRKRFKRRF